MQAASNLIKELGRIIGLEELALDDAGQCTLAFDETIVLTFLGDREDGLNVVSFIGELGAANAAGARMLLARNFVPNTLGGARVALEPESSRVVLVHRWPAVSTDFPTFQKQLEDFVNGVEVIRAELASVPEPSGALASPSSPQRREELPPPGAFA